MHRAHTAQCSSNWIQPTSPLSSPFSQCHGGQSLLMRIHLTQYSMRQNPVHTVRLRDSRYPLACSAAGPEELPRFGESAREIMTERNGQRWEVREHHLPLSLCINSIVAWSGVRCLLAGNAR